MQEIAANFELIGEELYEQAERIGLQQRDYNAIRALPPEDQDIIKQAIESGERDRLIDLMQEMAIKHGSEKAAAKAEKDRLQKDLDETKGILEAQKQITANKEEKINQLSTELIRRNKTAVVIDWPEEFKVLISQAQYAHQKIREAVAGLDVLKDKAMNVECNEFEQDSLYKARQMLALEIATTLRKSVEYIELIGARFDATLGTWLES